MVSSEFRCKVVQSQNRSDHLNVARRHPPPLQRRINKRCKLEFNSITGRWCSCRCVCLWDGSYQKTGDLTETCFFIIIIIFIMVPTGVPLAICMAHVMICSMSISSLCSLERYSYRDPPLAYSVRTHTKFKKRQIMRERLRISSTQTSIGYF